MTICRDINDSKFESKLRVLDTDEVKQKTFLFSVQGNSAWYVFMVFGSFVLYVMCLVHKINAQTNTTAILSTYLIHKFIFNVTCRMGGSHWKPYICFSFDFLIAIFCQWNMFNFGEHAQICHLPLTVWRLWKSYTFPDSYWNSLTWLTGND